MLNFFVKCLFGLLFMFVIVVVLVFLFVYLLLGDLVWFVVGFEVDDVMVVLVCVDFGFDWLLFV